ncbi:CAP domain-containing protein [Cytobacillus sp. NCCP-133]|uniref:CAP domain-containing protein n=1 Tax=Cytobacillus sp. NCCP-133 TaxID=766848 RepID=UPI00223110E1|nr:CAP domain-containing protein [Cytobacillus sp. NCCP-133]GLB60691.1 hypothetical protein NCCP133_28230 [Cytobacillus sp. NCCP-133]
MKIVIWKHFLLSLFFVLLLTACNNTEQGLNSRELTGNDLEEISNTNNANVERERRGSSPMEIQRVHNGYLTIDPNSYSTSLPSENFPHSQLTEDGGLPFFQFGEDEQGNQGMAPGQPEGGQFAQPYGQGGIGDQQPEAPQPREEADQIPAVPTPRGGAEQTPAAPAPREGGQAPASQAGGINNFEAKVIELTNAERSKNGLSALKADNPLSNVAQAKSNDMQQKNYFSHTSPTYGSPFDMMRDFGVAYNSAGENIAMGQQTPSEVVQAWMDSEGHRKNILNGTFTHIGVGYTESGSYWTQMFISK